MRTHIRLSIGLAVVTTLFAAGCGEAIDSSSVRTDGVYADFSATAKGNSKTLVHAGLKTGGPNSNTYLTLDSGDELLFHFDGTSYEPREKNTLGQFHTYQRKLEADAGGSNIRIEFDRADGVSAPDSTVTLPEKFEITSPESDDEISREQDLTIELSNSQQGTDMTASISGECLERSYSKDFPGDELEVTIPSSEIIADDDKNASERCSVSVTVERTKIGTVDAAFSDGKFEGIQERVASFTSTP